MAKKKKKMHLRTFPKDERRKFLLYFAPTYKARIRCGEEKFNDKKREIILWNTSTE